MALKQDGAHFTLFPQQGYKIESVVLNRVCIFRIFCLKQGQGLKPSATHIYPNIGRVSPTPPPGLRGEGTRDEALRMSV